MKHKTFKISILTLALTLIMALSAFFTINFMPAKASGTVTVNGTNVFTSTGDAEVIAHRQGDGEDAKYYTMFTFADGEDAVSYRRNLAYNWIESEKSGDRENGSETTAVSKMFGMEIGFASVTFEKFTIAFESQQYNKTKDNKSVNYIVFFPAGEGKLNVAVTDDKDVTKDEADAKQISSDFIEIKFTEKADGEYRLTVGNDGGESVEGVFKNVSGNYARSSTSSTNPVYPLIFKAEFNEDEEKDTAASRMVLYTLNGQSFELSGVNHNDTQDYYYGGTVTDNKAPVLCLNENISHFSTGGEVDIDYTVIDVLRTSPSSTVYYYVLGYDQFTDEELTDLNKKELFKEVEDDVLLESDINTYLPTKEVLEGTRFTDFSDKEGRFRVDMLTKVYINIKDTTSSNGESDEIYLDWYLPENYKVKVKDVAFIAVADDDLGVIYDYDGGNSTWSDAPDGKIATYQAKVDEAAKNLSAGSSSYFYLPSVESLFLDNSTAYTDMKFSIYYYHSSQQSNTNNKSNNLSINVTQQGAYTFTVYATDAAGNNMYYLDNGEIKEFPASEIWTMFEDRDDEGLYGKLPWFTFNVRYTGVSFDEVPGIQPTAYVGTSYNSASFDINGISGSYDTNYRLFIFDRAKYANDNDGATFSYESFIAEMDGLFENPATRKYFTEIREVNESDPDYDEFKDYGWKNSSTTFTPQDANGLYYMRAEVTDKKYNASPVTCSLAVVASIRASTIKGEDNWAQDNIASIILLSVAGLALIGIIVLLVIKPKDKEDIDVQYEKAKKKEKKNK